jgi:alkanesulfonate monooxygenase SsuD/methylene tetrahydromethanopterin reductase-like flavin-dependent oxidoreductase (luciferase family)
MKISAHMMCDSDLQVFLDTVRTSEAAGYDSIGLVDSHLLWREVYVYMTLALEATERIEIGPAVTNPITRDLTVTASTIATLAQLYPGRVVLGVGRGDSALRAMGRESVQTRKMADMIGTLRELVAGRSIDLAGSDVHLRFVDEDPKVPIQIAAMGPRNLKIAGAVADRVLLAAGANPAAVQWAVDQIRAGAEEAGRDPDSVELAALVALWVSDDQRDAWEHTRFHPAAAANHLRDAIQRHPDNHGLPADLVKLVPEKLDYDYYAGHLDAKAEHSQEVPDHLIDDYTIAGTPEKCLEKIQALADIGIHELATVYLTGEIDQLTRVGREIIPNLPGRG